jgi:hypothetical protein
MDSRANRWRFSRLAVALTVLAVDAWAEPPEMDSISPLDLLGELSRSRPIGTWVPAGYRAAGGFPNGWLIGADLGVAAPVAGPGQSASIAWALGIDAGYQYRNGISWSVRFDDDRIGLAPANEPGLISLTAGIRYSFPYLWPLPFVELDGGAALLHVPGGVPLGSSDTLALCGAAAVGLSFPILRYFAFDIVGRSWLAFGPQGGLVTFTVQGGVTIVFGFVGAAS